jgi:hypothetical protein
LWHKHFIAKKAFFNLRQHGNLAKKAEGEVADEMPRSSADTVRGRLEFDGREMVESGREPEPLRTSCSIVRIIYGHEANRAAGTGAVWSTNTRLNNFSDA